MATLFTQLQQRLPDNVKILQKISLLSPKNCLTPFKQSIVPLAELMMCSPAVSKREIQWGKLNFTEWRSIQKTADFLIEVDSYRYTCRENLFRELANLAIRLLVLSWSNAEVERLFSMMNLVKSRLRNRLSNDSTNAILTIRYGLKRKGICCDQYSFPETVFSQIGTMAAYGSKKSVSIVTSQDHFDLELIYDDEEDTDNPQPAAQVPVLHLPK